MADKSLCNITRLDPIRLPEDRPHRVYAQVYKAITSALSLLVVKGNPFLAFPRVLSPFSIFEDQVLKVKQAQRSLFDRETLLAKGNSNRQEAKELSQSIDHLCSD